MNQISCQILYKYINSSADKKMFLAKMLNINNYLMKC
jgi:hypothetical protein